MISMIFLFIISQIFVLFSYVKRLNKQQKLLLLLPFLLFFVAAVVASTQHFIKTISFFFYTHFLLVYDFNKEMNRKIPLNSHEEDVIGKKREYNPQKRRIKEQNTEHQKSYFSDGKKLFVPNN